MAFSIFGKRPTEPDQPAAPETQEPKRGLFDRMKQAVTRTRESFTESISSIVALTREVDETTLINLEPLLLAADLGAPTTALVMENLRQRALRTGIQGGDELKQLLKSELKAILDNVARPIKHPATPPEVIMMVGVNGTGKNKVIASGTVNSKGRLSVAWTARQSTTFLATYAGDADDAAVHASAAALVRAQVAETLSGQYGTKKSGGTTYRLYHHTAKVAVAATVTPGHPGECVKAELQEWVNGAWHASTTTGCTKLGTASKATVRLAVSKAQLGVPYRVRADYVSGSKTNASGASAWQYLMVEK